MTDPLTPIQVYVITFQGLAGMSEHPTPVPAGAFLMAWDVEANDGRGEADWTTSPEHALIFHNQEDAYEAWRAVPVACPLRADGAPNRPLTAFHIAVQPMWAVRLER